MTSNNKATNLRRLRRYPKLRKTRTRPAFDGFESLENRRVLASVSGFSFLDTNADGQRAVSEFGVPGVRIDVENANGSLSRSTLTTDLGFFVFSDLPAGNYTVTQHQPEATRDGTVQASSPGATIGQNRVANIRLNENEHVTDVYFAEASLKPEYVSITWLFASSTAPAHWGPRLRELVAAAEQSAGNRSLAERIRADADRGAVTEPVALDDRYQTTRGNTLQVDVPNAVIENDLNPESHLLVAKLLEVPEHGSITFNADGSFTYFPDSGFFGSDAFTYRTEGTNVVSNEARVAIQVVNVNAAPVSVDDAYEVDEDEVLSVGAVNGVLANDRDEDEDPLSVELLSPPRHGVLTLNADGSFTYTPTADFNGTDSFTYQASDGIDATEPATVTIVVHPVEDPIPGSVTLAASKDNSLFESPDGSLSNGAGEHLFVGKTLQDEGSLRRGLIAFDVSNIPSGATITNVALTMHMSRTIVGAFDVELRRALADWGEGPSDAEGPEGTGTDSRSGDATWLHTFYDNETWVTPGGDFAATASALTSVEDNGFYTWSSPQLAADVQAWLDSPETNHGWFLVSDETQTTAKRFDSRENATPANRPQLVVDYLFTPTPQAAAVLAPKPLEDTTANYPAAVDQVMAKSHETPSRTRRQTRFA